MIKSFFSIFNESANAFEGIEKGEDVLLLARKHPFVVILKLVYLIPLALLPVLMGIFFFQSIVEYELLSVFLFLSVVWILFLWVVLFYTLTMYTLDIWIVTNHRIIDSIQHGFFKRVISELHLSRIQDTSVNTTGVIQTFFRYGNVEIQTAGSEKRFKFDKVAQPEEVRNVIMRAVSENKPLY